jgi:hypothetical protein
MVRFEQAACRVVDSSPRNLVVNLRLQQLELRLRQFGLRIKDEKIRLSAKFIFPLIGSE